MANIMAIPIINLLTFLLYMFCTEYTMHKIGQETDIEKIYNLRINFHKITLLITIINIIAVFIFK